MKKTIRNIIKLTAFVLFLCVIFGAFTLILMPKTNTKEAGFKHVSAYSIINEAPDTIDVLILGTSQAYCSFIPLEIWKDIGVTSYVCSTPSQPLFYTEEFLQKALETQTPKLIVLETDSIFEKFSETSILEHKLEKALPLIAYHSRWKELTSEDFVFKYDYSQRHLGKGFVYDYRSVGRVGSDYMVPSDDVKNILSSSIYYLERIINICDQKNIELIFVSSLSAANWDYSKHNAVETIAQKYNIEYIDVNLIPEEVGLDWDNDWLDEGKHLNYYGAKKFTKWFATYLQKFDLLTDKRDLAEYHCWNEDAKQMDSEIQKVQPKPTE